MLQVYNHSLEYLYYFIIKVLMLEHIVHFMSTLTEFYVEYIMYFHTLNINKPKTKNSFYKIPII